MAYRIIERNTALSASILKTLKRTTIYITVGAAVLFGSLQYINWKFPSNEYFVARPRPYVAERSDVVKDYPEKTAECINLQVLEPTAKQRKKLQEDVGESNAELILDERAKLVDGVDIQPSEYGAMGFLYLEPIQLEDGSSSNKVRLLVVPKDQPFFEWINEQSLGIGLGITTSSEQLLRLDYRNELLRMGKVTLELEAGVMLLNRFDNSETIPYALISARIPI